MNKSPSQPPAIGMMVYSDDYDFPDVPGMIVLIDGDEVTVKFAIGDITLAAVYHKFQMDRLWRDAYRTQPLKG